MGEEEEKRKEKEKNKPMNSLWPQSSHLAFFDAVRRDDAEAIRRIVEGAGEKTSAASLMAVQDDKGETGLFVAAANSAENVFHYLVEFCDLETASIKSKAGITALHAAAKSGNTGIVKKILELWPELCRICDSTNTSPLYVAASNEHFDTVKAILDVDSSCLRIVRKNGKTCVHNRARFGSHRIVKALIERDPGVVSIADKKCQTALHMAVKGKDLDIVEELISADPSILNARDKKGNTALHVATRKWRPEIVRLLLSYRLIEVNALNNDRKTAMDLADESPYEHAIETREILVEAGAQHATDVLRGDTVADELRKEVRDLKQDLDSQHKQNLKTNRKVSDIAKELKKLHREAVQNTINSVTVVAVLIASIAFTAIFNLPGEYDNEGRANVAEDNAFKVFCLLNAMALFISLAVVVVQITLVAWETKAQEKIVKVVNKLMWAACVCICGAFLSTAFLDVGKVAPWMAVIVASLGGPMIFGTLSLMGYLVFRQWFKSRDDSQRAVRRSRRSQSFSLSRNSVYSDIDGEASDLEKSFYAL